MKLSSLTVRGRAFELQGALEDSVYGAYLVTSIEVKPLKELFANTNIKLVTDARDEEGAEVWVDDKFKPERDKLGDGFAEKGVRVVITSSKTYLQQHENEVNRLVAVDETHLVDRLCKIFMKEPIKSMTRVAFLKPNKPNDPLITLTTYHIGEKFYRLSHQTCKAKEVSAGQLLMVQSRNLALIAVKALGFKFSTPSSNLCPTLPELLSTHGYASVSSALQHHDAINLVHEDPLSGTMYTGDFRMTHRMPTLHTDGSELVTLYRLKEA